MKYAKLLILSLCTFSTHAMENTIANQQSNRSEECSKFESLLLLCEKERGLDDCKEEEVVSSIIIESPNNVPCDVSELGSHELSFDDKGQPHINGCKIRLIKRGSRGVVTRFDGKSVKLTTHKKSGAIVVEVRKMGKLIAYYSICPYIIFDGCVAAELITKCELNQK